MHYLGVAGQFALSVPYKCLVEVMSWFVTKQDITNTSLPLSSRAPVIICSAEECVGSPSEKKKQNAAPDRPDLVV
jgi:hypothetical protein